MAADDWAIVAGINRYPALGDLGGPENDARIFHQWLLDKAGVPPSQACLILSSQFQDPANDALHAHPSSEQIEQEFDKLEELAEQNQKNGKGFHVGRRLYVFFAGHGFTPRGDEAALLTANATRRRTHHVPGRPYTNWFLNAGVFDEIILLMDCCREVYKAAVLRLPPYVDLIDTSAVNRSKILYGFATKWSKLAREKLVEGKARGVFTLALMAGLNGAASDPQGRITAKSLSDYLYNNMKRFLDQAELQDPNIPKEPELDYDPNPAKTLVIVQTPASTFPVTFNLGPGDIGKQIRIHGFHGGRFQKISEQTVQQLPLTVPLRTGSYLATLLPEARETDFVVGGEGQIHVDL